MPAEPKCLLCYCTGSHRPGGVYTHCDPQRFCEILRRTVWVQRRPQFWPSAQFCSWNYCRWWYVSPYLLKLTPELTVDVSQVSANANIDSAAIPDWRAAKAHVAPSTVPMD